VYDRPNFLIKENTWRYNIQAYRTKHVYRSIIIIGLSYFICREHNVKTRSSAVAERPRDASCLYSFYTLEWCGYPMVKKIPTYVYSFWHDPRTWKNRRFHVPQPTFLFPLETPLRLSRNMLHGWKDNSMPGKRLAACTHLSSIVSELYDAQVNA